MEESEYFKNSKFNARKVALTLTHCVLEDNNCCFVAKDNNKIIGLVAGYIGSAFYTDDRYLREYGVWVNPEYRERHLGLLLVQHWLNWGKDKNIDEIWFTWMSGIEIEKAQNMLNKFGFYEEGLIYKNKLKRSKNA